MGEKKVDIKSLLEQNNVELHEGVTNKDLINKNTVDTSQVENYSPDNGMSVAEEEMMRVRGRKGGGVPNGVISAEQMASIEETLREIEAETELAKAEFEKFQQQKQEEEEKAKRLNPERREILDDESLSDEDEEMVEVEEFEDETESRGDFNKRYEEAVVIIDKTGMGNVIDFTDAEREKLQKVKTIKLKEVETIELQSIKTKKAKVGVADKILQKRNSVRNTNVVLPVSGFTAVMKGCSTFELMGLINSNAVDVMALVAKWTLVHSKIESTSIGKLNFNNFLNSVSSMEYDMLVYGILCATFPDEDTFPLTCPKCRTNIEHKYTVRSLLRAEEMSEELASKVKEVADASYTENMAKECFENSILNTETTIKLPISEFVCTLGVQNA